MHLTPSPPLLYLSDNTSIDSNPFLLCGEVYKHHSLRIAYFHQHQQDCLPFDLTPLQYMASLVGVILSTDNDNDVHTTTVTNSSIHTISTMMTNSEGQWNEQKLRAHLESQVTTIHK